MDFVQIVTIVHALLAAFGLYISFKEDNSTTNYVANYFMLCMLVVMYGRLFNFW